MTISSPTDTSSEASTEAESGEVGIMDLLEEAGETPEESAVTEPGVDLPPSSFEVAVGGSRFDAMRQASWPQDQLAREEGILIAQNPSRWRAAPVWAMGISTITFSVAMLFVHLIGHTPTLLNAIFSFITVTTVPSWYPFLVLIPGAIGAVGLFGEALQRAFTWNIVSETQVLVRRRILSRFVENVGLDQINKLELAEPFPLRLVNVGHIYIYTPGTDDCEIELSYLKNPELVKDAIMERGENITVSTDS